VEWYHVCWPRLTAKRVEPVVSISWASCYYNNVTLLWSIERLKAALLLVHCEMSGSSGPPKKRLRQVAGQKSLSAFCVSVTTFTARQTPGKPGTVNSDKNLVPICLYCLKCTKFGQLVLAKILKLLPPDVRF